MIEIKRISDIEKAREICQKHGIKWAENYFVIATIEKDITLHSAVFSYQNKVGEIHAIDGFDGDLAMLDGLCRAILNIMDINGIEEVSMPIKYADLAKMVGFTQTDDKFRLKLEGFFKCNCGKRQENLK